MIHKYNIVLLIISLSLLGSCEKYQYEPYCTECYPFPNPKGIYEYPIVPGDEEWENLISAQMRLDACQIPESILSDMSTEALVETCVNWPLLPELLFIDFPSGGAQRAMQTFIEKFNGLNELTKRTDSGTYLLNHYLCKEAFCYIHHPEPNQSTIDISFFEVILSQYIFLDSMSNDQLFILVSKSLINLKQKRNYPDVYNLGISENSSALVLARALKLSDYLPLLSLIESDTKMYNFVELGRLPLPDEFLVIIKTLKEFAEDYLSED